MSLTPGLPFPIIPFVGIVAFLLALTAEARVLDFRVVDGETSAPIEGLSLNIQLNEKWMTAKTDKAGRFEIELPEDGVAFLTIETGVPPAGVAAPVRYRLREFAIRPTEDGKDEPPTVARARDFLRGLAADVRTEDDFHRLGDAREPEGFEITLRGQDKWVDVDYRDSDFADQLATLEPGRVAGPYRDGDEFLLVWLLEKPAASGFIPMSVALARPWWPAERNKLPERFTLALQHGTAIGGVVRGQNGQSLEGATVHLSVPFTDAPDSRARPIIDKQHLTTNAQGRWRFGGVPFHIDGLLLAADHPDYQPQNVGRIEDLAQIARLRDLRHEIILEKVPVLRGTVLDAKGEPIQGARVSSAFAERQFPTLRQRTDENGQFRITNLPAYGSYYVAVQAPGCAADMQRVELTPDTPPLTIRLGAGKKFEARVVDENGRPVPDVRVTGGPWQGFYLLSGWEARTDEEGRFQLDGLPVEGLSINLRKGGYVNTSSIAVPGNAGDITLRTVRILRMTGKVVDEETGRPIPAFTVVKSGTREDSPGTILWTHRQGIVQKGRYEAELDRNATHFQLRVDAPGYLTYISPVFTVKDGNVVHDVKLKPASRVSEIERVTEPANREVDEVFEVDEFTAALWRFNKTGAPDVLVDSSPNRNDGTIRGAEWVRGFRGNGLYFDGIRDAVIVDGSRSLNIRDRITIEALVKYAYESEGLGQRSASWERATNLTQGIVDRGSGLGSHGGYYLRFSYRRPDFAVSMPYVETYTTAVLQPERWHYVAAVYDNQSVQIYVDGRLTRTRSLGRGNLREWEDRSYLIIGCEGAGNFFNGVLDEIRISNTARTAEEIERNWTLMTDPEAARRAAAPPPAETYRFDLEVVERGTDKRLGKTSLTIETTTGTIEAATNSNGCAVLDLPASMKYVAVVARKKGFVPVRAKLMQPWTSDERAVETLISQTLEMPCAVTIGGRIVGSDGKGREGVRLSISFPPDGDDLAGHIQVEDFVTTSGAGGKWACSIAPEKTKNVEIRVQYEETPIRVLQIEEDSEIKRLMKEEHVILL